MANVSVSYQEMQDQASKLNQAQQDIATQLNALKTQVNGLVAGGFVTDAASAQFEQSYHEFDTGANKCMEGLTGMATYLTKAAETFRDVDSQLANALKG